MIMLGVLSEGRSEVQFIKNVLADYLVNYDIFVEPITIPTTMRHGINAKGGWRRSGGYQYGIDRMKEIIKMKRYPAFTTLFDFYGFPSDIPCFSEAMHLSSPYDKVERYENQLSEDIVVSDFSFAFSFIPYVQPYEFEALVFVDPEISSIHLSDTEQEAEAIRSKLTKIRNDFETPEHINNDFSTAPSKRLENIVPGYISNKAGKAGFSWRIPRDIGMPSLQSNCKHFSEWIKKLESLNV